MWFIQKNFVFFHVCVLQRGMWGWGGDSGDGGGREDLYTNVSYAYLIMMTLGWDRDSGDGGGRERVYTPMCPIHT